MTNATISSVIAALSNTPLSHTVDQENGTVTVYGFAGSSDEFAPIEMIVRRGADDRAVVTLLATGYGVTADDLNATDVAEWIMDTLA